MKNLIKHIVITSTLMLSLIQPAYSVEEGFTMNASDIEKQAAQCMQSVVDEKNNVKSDALKSEHESIAEKIEAYKNTNRVGILDHAYIANNCAHMGEESILEDPPVQGSAQCRHPVTKKLVENKDPAKKKTYAAKFFCLNKAAFDLNDENFEKIGQTQIDESNYSEQASSPGDISEESFSAVGGSKIYEELKKKSESFYEALSANGAEVSANSGKWCGKQFGSISNDIAAMIGAEKHKVIFNSFVAPFRDGGLGVSELHRDLQVKTPARCAGAPLAIGDISIPAPFNDGKEGAYTSSAFFTRTSDNSAAAELAATKGIQKRFCMDLTRQYCAPLLQFYAKCDEVNDGNAQAACQTIAYKTFLDCASTYSVGEIYNIKVPAEAFTGNLESVFTVAPSADGQAVTDTKEYVRQSYEAYKTNSNLVSMKDAYQLFYTESPIVTQLINDQEQRTLEHNFHDYYGMCVVYREASKKNDDDSGRVPIGSTVASVNGAHSCTLIDPWTSDYKYCNMAILWADGFSDILGIATNTTMGVVSSVKSQQAMNESTKQALEGDPTGAMTIQKQELKNKSAHHLANAAVDTTSAAGSFIAWSKYPSPKRLANTCRGGKPAIYGSQAIDCGMHHAYSESWIVAGDRQATYASIFPNAKIKEVLMMKMIQKFGSGLMNTLMGREYSRQAGMLDKLQEGIKDFFDDPTYSLGDDVASLSYCKQNPTVPSCKKGSRRDNSLQGGMNFNGAGSQGQGGGNFGFGNNGAGEYLVDEKEDAIKRKAIDDLKGVIANTKRNKFGSDFNAPAAGKGSNNGGGGGGGSVAGSARAGGGGGGGAGASAANSASGQSLPRVGKNTYTSGSGDSFKYKAGSSDSTKSKATNPFASMIGKKNRKVASQIVDDIAPQKSQLFEKISKAYSKAKKDNRLLNIQSE